MAGERLVFSKKESQRHERRSPRKQHGEFLEEQWDTIEGILDGDGYRDYSAHESRAMNEKVRSDRW